MTRPRTPDGSSSARPAGRAAEPDDGPGRPGPGPTGPVPRAGAGRAWAAWGLAVSAYFVAVFHRTSLGVASLEAERRFHTGPSVLATFVAAQLALYAGLQIPRGPWRTASGPAACSPPRSCSWPPARRCSDGGRASATALAGRALVGIGDGLTFLNVLRLVQNWFPASRYGLLTALTSLVGGVGQLVSTEPLRLSLSHLGWVATFVGSAGGHRRRGGRASPLFVRDRPDTAARLPLRERPSMRRAVRHAMRTPGTWQGMWAHFALTGPVRGVHRAVGLSLPGPRPSTTRARAPASPSGSWSLSSVLSAPFVGMLIVRAPRRPLGGGEGQRLGPARRVDRRVELGWRAACPSPSSSSWRSTTGACAGRRRSSPSTWPAEANPPERGGAATGVVQHRGVRLRGDRGPRHRVGAHRGRPRRARRAGLPPRHGGGAGHGQPSAWCSSGDWAAARRGPRLVTDSRCPAGLRRRGPVR